MTIEKPSLVDVLRELEINGFFRRAGSPFTPPKISGGRRIPTAKEAGIPKALHDALISPLSPREVAPNPLLPSQMTTPDQSFSELDLAPFLDHISSDDFDPSTIGKATKDKGWDAAAWYCPIHFYGFKWGIYIRIKSVYEIALDILNVYSSPITKQVLDQAKRRVLWFDKNSDLSEEQRAEHRHLTEVASTVYGRPYRAWLDHGLEEPIIQAIMAAYFVLFHHEFFHHMVESLGIRVESFTERPVYISYADSVYKVAKGTPNLVEEALANAFAYRAAVQPAFASFLSRKPHAVNSNAGRLFAIFDGTLS
jgi:hypothetical protein